MTDNEYIGLLILHVLFCGIMGVATVIMCCNGDELAAFTGMSFFWSATMLAYIDNRYTVGHIKRRPKL